MATLTTYRTIQDRVLDIISKSDSTTRNRVKDSINNGYYDFVLRELWPFREVTGTLNTVAGTQEYDLSTNFSTLDEQNIRSVTLQGSVNKKLVYWPWEQLRADQPDLDLAGSSVPERYYLKAGQIGFWPVPADVYSVAIDYYKTPTAMVSDDTVPIVPAPYLESLVQYALSDEHDFNSDPDLAIKAQNRYEQILTLARNNLLAQPTDTGAFKILGPQDSVNWTGASSEIR